MFGISDIELYFLDVSMQNPHLLPLRVKLPDQILGSGHRPVPSTRAAEGDGQIGPPLLEVVGKRKTKKSPHLL
jgi:hypothetical protein